LLGSWVASIKPEFVIVRRQGRLALSRTRAGSGAAWSRARDPANVACQTTGATRREPADAGVLPCGRCLGQERHRLDHV